MCVFVCSVGGVVGCRCWPVLWVLVRTRFVPVGTAASPSLVEVGSCACLRVSLDAAKIHSIFETTKFFCIFFSCRCGKIDEKIDEKRLTKKD